MGSMRLGSLLAVSLFALSASALAGQPEKCGGAAIANGPFSYAPSDAGAATFLGSAGNAQQTQFSVTAPNASGDPVVFPGQGQNPCVGSADATIGVFEVTKVADADGNPVAEEVSGALYGQIAGAFAFSPVANTFTPGSSVTVNVTIGNPNVGSADYGEYSVKLAAQAPGAGIGVGSGARYALTLAAATVGDTTPPVVTVTKPSGTQILGVIPVEIVAEDPVPGTGVASMAATVSSAGGAVSGLAVALTVDQVLPVAAGVAVTATGSFTPTGGTGSAGTTDALAFTASSLSGIGTYTLNAEATDVAGNTGYGSKTFGVTYAVAFTRQFAASNCATRTGSSGAQCTGMFSFTANRSSVTSDGAAMYDHTVVVDLVRTSDDTIAASHLYGTGSILAHVQLDATTAVYSTHFKRGDFGAVAPGTYVAKVYFLDVDGNVALQATSAPLTF